MGLGQTRRWAGSGSLTARSPTGAQPAAIRPVSRAEPIFPPPTTSSFGAMPERYQRPDRPPGPSVPRPRRSVEASAQAGGDRFDGGRRR